MSMRPDFITCETKWVGTHNKRKYEATRNDLNSVWNAYREMWIKTMGIFGGLRFYSWFMFITEIKLLSSVGRIRDKSTSLIFTFNEFLGNESFASE